MLFLFLLAQADPSPYPYPWVWQEAQAFRDGSRLLYSDYPEIYRYTWSFSLEAPCPRQLDGADGPGPCSALPFIQDQALQLPAVLYLAYQTLTYTAPREPGSPKASLALSRRYTLISAGVQWELTVNSEGIKHDIFLCHYAPFSSRIIIAPLVWLDVTMLRPAGYYHLEVTPHGQYNLQTHQLRAWDLFTDGMLTALYEQLPDEPHCGTPAYVYRTRPAELLMEAIGSFVPDVAQLAEGDAQRVVTPFLDHRYCGEFSYKIFHKFMLHRGAPTPSLVPDGPPLETWTVTGKRDVGQSTHEALDPDQPPAHSKVAAVREDLQLLGMEGEWIGDPVIKDAIDGQEAAGQEDYKKSANLGDTALAVLDTLIKNPGNADSPLGLWELATDSTQYLLDRLTALFQSLVSGVLWLAVVLVMAAIALIVLAIAGAARYAAVFIMAIFLFLLPIAYWFRGPKAIMSGLNLVTVYVLLKASALFLIWTGFFIVEGALINTARTTAAGNRSGLLLESVERFRPGYLYTDSGREMVLAAERQISTVKATPLDRMASVNTVTLAMLVILLAMVYMIFKLPAMIASILGVQSLAEDLFTTMTYFVLATMGLSKWLPKGDGESQSNTMAPVKPEPAPR